MAFDLIVRGGTLPDGRVADIGINGETITAIEPTLQGPARTEVDARGNLVSPPFVDPHFHMDATLSYGIPRINASGTLLEGISLWGELKPLLTHEAVRDRALAYCDWAVSMGLLAIRTHVDVCDDRLLAVEALLEVKKTVAPYIDLQLVAFPQDGFYRAPSARENTIRALDMGVDIVGGIPHFERTMADGTRSVTELCEIAARRGLMVDLHCDETDDPLSRHIEQLAYETQRLGLQGKVAGSHLTSMHSMDNYYVSKLLPLIAEADVSVIPNPLINIMLQGRHDTFPKRRGLTRVKEMLALGIRVGWGQDCVLDPWYSLGTADMLDVAFMGLHVAQMSSPAEMARCFDMVTNVNAAIMGLDHLGLAVGKRASLVVLDAGNPVEALRLRAERLCVIARGKVVAERTKQETRLSIDGRPVLVNRRHHSHQDQ
ncbi:cytosine deaminase [Mesorhizobium sp. M7A.F.Ca.CA.001.07.2.1]|uniref:amidohydrolase family protein n=2 Tax=Phyllobacteriaceae TaxID=69277 RepID=UPI000FCC1C06|nr:MULTISPECIES: amidohydrolase family protein [Mesorhizobium]MCF6126366.1 amidohydrolase family protein [Mesorhizobium ciceri]MCQ8817324.1 amidohydrolase family protein [Mesorhizobium sp. SEMIA396]RUX74147.1 cytosine deaminase [Mesorhizobium sp. M7A.F.Ca.CA.004.08.2.1]RUX87718.1 cytosine deaminase [Mesorhizobium sp. M7A.F.Ca.CA.004.08.1.1]RUY04543.1 cytosine deaminase [Mesorhizobium sp. M7A.F.Ca.CA.004.04.1.1]